jgi:hypothetical protein
MVCRRAPRGPVPKRGGSVGLGWRVPLACRGGGGAVAVAVCRWPAVGVPCGLGGEGRPAWRCGWGGGACPWRMRLIRTISIATVRLAMKNEASGTMRQLAVSVYSCTNAHLLLPGLGGNDGKDGKGLQNVSIELRECCCGAWPAPCLCCRSAGWTVRGRCRLKGCALMQALGARP